MKLQTGKCNECGLIFKEGDIIEIDHSKPKNLGLDNSYSSKPLLRKYYHSTKTYKTINPRTPYNYINGRPMR